MKKVTLTTCLLLATLGLTTKGRTEESEPFFEKDFARAPSREGRDPMLEVGPPAESTSEAPAEAPVSPTKDSIQSRVNAALDRARKPPGSSTPQGTPVPSAQMKIAVVGGVLDSSSLELMTRQVEDMLSVLEKSKILISTIYGVGPRQALPNRVTFRVAKLHGRILFVDELPKKYQLIKSAPSWIFTSLDQEIVLEAAGPLSENLAPDGTIITKAQRIPATPAAPQKTP